MTENFVTTAEKHYTMFKKRIDVRVLNYFDYACCVTGETFQQSNCQSKNILKKKDSFLVKKSYVGCDLNFLSNHLKFALDVQIILQI